MSEAQTSTGPYTWDDFVALEEDDLRELIDGELVEVEAPTKLHEYIVWLLSHHLGAWALPRKAGFATPPREGTRPSSWTAVRIWPWRSSPTRAVGTTA
jgi:Uma2 family endonuclease